MTYRLYGGQQRGRAYLLLEIVAPDDDCAIVIVLSHMRRYLHRTARLLDETGRDVAVYDPCPSDRPIRPRMRR